MSGVERETPDKKIDKHGLVIERHGRRYALDRPAYRGDDGSFDLAQLRSDEVMVSPGVIYREVPP